jgi:hypothetical protein
MLGVPMTHTSALAAALCKLTIEHAQPIANHEAPPTTKLYDRVNDAISLDERACPAVPGIERILI